MEEMNLSFQFQFCWKNLKLKFKYKFNLNLMFKFEQYLNDFQFYLSPFLSLLLRQTAENGMRIIFTEMSGERMKKGWFSVL